ncbi:MAG: hypothetical protein AB7S87_06310 [Burkholderiales bacterium]
MSTLRALADGGYDFLEGVFPYSQGVIAREGYELERVQFARVLPLAEGFAAIAAHLEALGRPKTALCAAELRSPRPFSFDGFGAFNRVYVDVLAAWGLVRGGLNPVARSNVAPEVSPPAEPGFHAFCCTVPSTARAPRDYVVAGSGEWPEGARFPEDIVARGDATDDGLRRKVEYVLGVMQARLAGLGARWAEASATQVYTVRDFHACVPAIAARAGSGLAWNYCRPPIEGLEFEMDLRRVTTERWLAP